MNSTVSDTGISMGTAGFQVGSPAFLNGARIPAKYTVDGINVSPPLEWSHPPSDTKSLALILDDPDARMPSGFIHWVVFNIPPDRRSLPENAFASRGAELGILGSNGTGKPGYIGPAPPTGTGNHLYRFNLYALDKMLDLKPAASKEELLAAMGGHMIGNALLTGVYSHAVAASG